VSLYGFEGIKALIEEVDALVDKGWILERREVEWGVAYLYRPVAKYEKQGIGGSLHQEVPSYLPIKPTRAHALSNPTSDNQEERLLRAGEANRKLAKLTVEERQALLLHAKRYMSDEQIDVPVDEMATLLDAGWLLVRQENGVATLSGRFVTEMTQEQIGELLGMSQQHVSKLLKRAYGKLGQ
jgi:RNA polymerase sigma factor (sigma-70 family)